MLLGNRRLHALKGAIYSAYVDFRTSWYIFTTILACILVLEFFLINLIPSGSSMSNTSMLNTGFITGLFVMGISMIVITGNGEILKRFSFPIDRLNLLVSHAAFIFIGSLALLLTSCALYLVELLLSNIISAIFPGFVYVAVITKGSFIAGFFVSWATLVCLSATVYFVSMYLFRYKLFTIIAAVIIFMLCVNFGSIGKVFSDIFNGIFLNTPPALLCIKLIAASLLFLSLSFIPLKRMEVKQ